MLLLHSIPSWLVLALIERALWIRLNHYTQKMWGQQHCQSSPFTSKIKRPLILIFSIAIGANYSFYVKSIATYAPTFLRYNCHSASVRWSVHVAIPKWPKNQFKPVKQSRKQALRRAYCPNVCTVPVIRRELTSCSLSQMTVSMRSRFSSRIE